MNQPYYPQQPTMQPEPKNSLATAAMVLGIVSVVLAIIPVIGMVAWITGPLAVIFGFIGLRKRIKKGQSITGIATGGVAIVICIIWLALTGAAMNEAAKTYQKIETSTPDIGAVSGDKHQVEYKILGEGSGTVTLMGENAQMSQKTVEFPYTSKDTVKGFEVLSLSAMNTGGSGKTTCEIWIDGKKVTSNSSSGKYTTVSCNFTMK